MIDWLMENWVSVLEGASMIVAGAAVLAAVTKSPKDDAALAKARRVLDWLALNVGNAKNRSP